MPEIPDLEAIRGFLNQRLPGAAVERAEYLIPVVFRVPKEEFVRMLEGATFGETRRRGKFLVFHLESGQRLVINAMLTGRFQYLRPDVKRRAKTCLVLGLANGWDLRYADDRLMGKVYLVTEDGLGAVPQWSEMGPDALEVTKEEFAQQIR
ncbi:MAG: DNA-formamidopyrimidine glycosylase family protein, partial [Dehalococcoidia bacterium]|nr:DNA-formamidopyrimidine glycosylase family protein [Dehalococcoidia bacterium]